MDPVKMHEAKTHFSKLIALVEQGEEVIVQRGDVRVAKIVPYVEQRAPRKAGQFKGRIWMAPDFDETPSDFRELLG